jgi:3-dehydroquinate dehydratase
VKVKDKKLKRLVRRLATFYGFIVTYDDVMERWNVKDEELNCSLFWTSHESEDDFIQQVKEHFEEIGGERVGLGV